MLNADLDDYCIFPDGRSNTVHSQSLKAEAAVAVVVAPVRLLG